MPVQPADDIFDTLEDRLTAATYRAAENGDPSLGTVELTITELAEVIHRHAGLARQLSGGAR